MRRIVSVFTGACAALLIFSTPADARYHLMSTGQTQPVGKLGLSVTPDVDWNRLGSKIGRNAESWTFDGLPLNDLSFYGGIIEGQSLFRDADKKQNPLPKFSATMLPTDIVQLFEGSYRVAAHTALFDIDKVEPTSFAGQAGVHFSYHFTVQGEEVMRKGEATGAIINHKLYLVTFEAPVIYYFDRDIAHFHAIVATARVS